MHTAYVFIDFVSEMSVKYFLMKTKSFQGTFLKKLYLNFKKSKFQVFCENGVRYKKVHKRKNSLHLYIFFVKNQCFNFKTKTWFRGYYNISRKFRKKKYFDSNFHASLNVLAAVLTKCKSKVFFLYSTWMLETLYLYQTVLNSWSTDSIAFSLKNPSPICFISQKCSILKKLHEF